MEDDSEPIPLPNVNSATLKRILTWIAQHQVRLDLDYFPIIFVWKLAIILLWKLAIIFVWYICDKGGEDRARVGGEAGQEGIGEVRDPPLLPPLANGLFVSIF